MLTLQPGADWIDAGYSPFLAGIIFLAGIGTAALFFISVRAFLQRRTARVLLIVVALAALVVRTIVGFGTVLGFVPMTVHHLVSHSLDFFVAVVILYGVYRSSPELDTGSAD